ncbi:hypothetical protein V525_23080 [Gordonia alkanivorans CGMCC 6845]|uniref:ABC transporter domain-containing protein n=1 Tax=Gordonia alkanivorans CGMCC 6845 TaxID=1423140 RepID=W9DE68_9ACTN|nr:ATP-binding cassette domain-containing protein [Gordonia alkanivorans]ETA04620.1 hypothetical protein V525_23080 [Gordonia alkanivorans CGMCC 6845]
MPEATERVAAQEPRHRRREAEPDVGADPFEMPDPVAEKLRQWRSEREPSAEHNGHSVPDRTPGRDSVTATASAEGPSASTGSPPESAPTEEMQSAPVAMPEWQTSADQPGEPGSTTAASTAWSQTDASPEPSESAAKAGTDTTAPFAAPGATPAIEVRNLHKRFKDTVAVEDVSFTVQPGRIVAILGPNGAGKTTTVNMLCTLLKPDGGSATVHGHDVVSEAPAVRKSIMLTGQFAALDESLTGRENLILFGRLLGLSKSDARARADELLDTFSLLDAGAKKVGKYSGGMRRRIDIACGLVTAPKVVFLDEPTTGLDPRSRIEVWSLVEKLRESGVTILLTTQYLEEADTLADNIVVIDKGRVVAEGSSDELKDSIGAAYCEVTAAHPEDLDRLRDVLADLNPSPPSAADYEHIVAVPAPRGPETLVEVIRRTTAAGIALSDVALRRPSLDEVFLALTDPRRDRRPTT